MAPLKENLKGILKKHHKGAANSVTMRDLLWEVWPIRTDGDEIKRLIKELASEGVPIVSEIPVPGSSFHLYYADENER